MASGKLLCLCFQHPHLLRVLAMDYIRDSDQVVVTQYGQGASLRDLVYQEVS